MKRKIGFIVIFALSSLGILIADSSGPGSDCTGAPLLNGTPGSTCSQNNCHAAGSDLGGNVAVKLTEKGLTTPVTQYQSWKTYTVTVTVAGTSSSKYGFSATILDAARVKNGVTNGAGSGCKIVTLSNRSIAMHNTPSVSGVFSFDWTPPTSLPKDSVILYVAGNATNGDDGKTGDQIVLLKKTFYLNKTANGPTISTTNASVYPNPVSDIVHFNAIMDKVTLVNFQGVTVLSAENVSELDVRGIAAGMYYLHTDGITKKLVKM